MQQIQSTTTRLLEPTITINGFHVAPGDPLPFGATVRHDSVNFSIYSYHATSCTLVFFRKGEAEPCAEIPIPDGYRIGSVYPIRVYNLTWENVEYGYRFDGPWEPEKGHRFDKNNILLDPYAKAIGGREIWGKHPDWTNPNQHRGRIITGYYDWGMDRPLETPIEDLIIYEMHVRGFTKHPSSGVKNPGTFDAIREKIPYLKSLGVNAIELMPIFEFDEFEDWRRNPETGETLLNYWGYSSVCFQAPKVSYAATAAQGTESNELKTLIKELHRNGIEVILDVVFNHTAEGNEKGPSFSFKGIDNQTYYILTPDGYYYNFSGTGNAFNCNHPTVRSMIMDCLRYWVSEYHIDGFRFDLASIMTRDVDGTPLPDPPLLRMMAFDPILGTTKLIAEPWDADGLYHLGSFPAYKRWSEWNGYYRDTLRKFLRGDAGQVKEIANVMTGSKRLYPERGPIASINFITAHDGFTMLDLVTFNEKYNEANCLSNDNGANNNYSWNSGFEGATDDLEINALRRRRIKNAVTLLMCSLGTPMLLMGDEIGRTQLGNNNAFCQDNEVSWFDWDYLEKNADLFGFFQAMIAFRKAHPLVRQGYFLRGEDYQGKGYADMAWHGLTPDQPDWSPESQILALQLGGGYGKGGLEKDDHLYIAMNMSHTDATFEIPLCPGESPWQLFVNTGDAEHSFYPIGEEPLLENQATITLLPLSVVILVAHLALEPDPLPADTSSATNAVDPAAVADVIPDNTTDPAPGDTVVP